MHSQVNQAFSCTPTQVGAHTGGCPHWWLPTLVAAHLRARLTQEDRLSCFMHFFKLELPDLVSFL